MLRLERQHQELCNKALDNYVNHNGPPPPSMCNADGDPPTPSTDDSPTMTPGPTASYGQSFTNCTTDTIGGRHCVTNTPGKPLIFTNCTTDSLGGQHCTSN